MSTPRSRRVVFLAILLGFAIVSPAHAQRRRQQGGALPQPNLQSIFPLGVTEGGAAEITLRGSDLEGVTTLWFDHPGLRAVLVKGVTFKVTCEAGTPAGIHDVRAVGTYGVSNPRAIVVGDRPEAVETEPNNTAAQAQVIPINSVVNGEVGAADLDFFAFEGKKGQRLRLELLGERVDSRLDATMHLIDAQGREIAEDRDSLGLDPFLDVTLPADGRYLVKVHDVTYRGSNEYPYRLSLTEGPWLDAAEPHILKPGSSTKVTLYGRNIGGEACDRTAFDGRPLERKVVEIKAPETLDLNPAAPSLGYVGSTSATRRGFEYTLKTDAGRSNPIFFALSNDPIVVETEPNDGDPAQVVTLPCDIAGRFEKPGDLDVFRFKAKKGEVWWVEASAERIGSPADPVFVIQKVGEKGATSDLTTGDDLPDKGGQARLFTASVDAAVRWSVPEDGEFQVAVSDLYSSQRGNVRLAYRLNIRPERPDFHLFLLPDSPTQPDAVTLNAGGRALAYLLAWRVDGFNGPIRVEALDLPDGVYCDPITIPPDQSLAPIVLQADAAARPKVGTIRLVGRGRLGDRKNDAGPVSLASSPEVVHESIGAGLVWPAAAPTGPGVSRLIRGFVVKVLGPAPLTLDAAPKTVKANPGGLVSLDLRATRREGFTEAVAVTLVNPLPGLPNPPPTGTVAKGADTGTFTLTLPKGISPGVYSLVLQGAGPYPFNKDANAKNKPNVTLNEPSNVVTLWVRPSPATVAIGTKGGNIKVGETLGVEVTVTPKEPSVGPITVSLDAPAALKLQAEPVTATAGKPATLSIKAAADSPAGALAGAALRIQLPWRGELVEMIEPLPLTAVK